MGGLLSRMQAQTLTREDWRAELGAAADELFGTEPVFEYVEHEGLEPAALLYFTDLYGSFPGQPPPYPTLWLNCEDPNNQAPFGQTVHVSPTAHLTEPKTLHS